MKKNKKPCKMTKVIERRETKTSEANLVENITKNLQSFLKINPVQKEVLRSPKLLDHAYE